MIETIVRGDEEASHDRDFFFSRIRHQRINKTKVVYNSWYVYILIPITRKINYLVYALLQLTKGRPAALAL